MLQKKDRSKVKDLEELIKNNNTEQKLDEYISEFNKQILLILNIESTPAIDNLDSIFLHHFSNPDLLLMNNQF